MCTNYTYVDSVSIELTNETTEVTFVIQPVFLLVFIIFFVNKRKFPTIIRYMQSRNKVYTF